MFWDGQAGYKQDTMEKNLNAQEMFFRLCDYY